jgi:hypothetical protein
MGPEGCPEFFSGIVSLIIYTIMVGPFYFHHTIKEIKTKMGKVVYIFRLLILGVFLAYILIQFFSGKDLGSRNIILSVFIISILIVITYIIPKIIQFFTAIIISFVDSNNKILSRSTNLILLLFFVNIANIRENYYIYLAFKNISSDNIQKIMLSLQQLIEFSSNDNVYHQMINITNKPEKPEYLDIYIDCLYNMKLHRDNIKKEKERTQNKTRMDDLSYY